MKRSRHMGDLLLNRYSLAGSFRSAWGYELKHQHLGDRGAKQRARLIRSDGRKIMGAGGPAHRALERIRRPIPFDPGVGSLSLGGPQPLILRT